nr:golgin subfamily A member like [Tanacetum cinerariifolium]
MLVILLKPFTLFKISCMAGLRGIAIVINTWVEILIASIFFNVNVFWRFVLWTVSLITLPVRAVAALRREKQLQAQVGELQDRVESLAWDRKELQEHIRIAINEHEVMEMMLVELEEEHDEALHKIKLLETELQDLKDENLQVKEVHGKLQWDIDTRVGAGYGYEYGQKLKDAKVSNPEDGVSLWKSDHYMVTDILMHKDRKFDAHIIPGVMNRSQCTDNALGVRREVAFSQSLFSAVLSLLVGIIIWESQDPCMPLVTALFMVVGMSLRSVVQFFSTIKNKQASDAVALLSLNWFILGTLTYPTLPRVARLTVLFFTK